MHTVYIPPWDLFIILVTYVSLRENGVSRNNINKIINRENGPL